MSKLLYRNYSFLKKSLNALWCHPPIFADASLWRRPWEKPYPAWMERRRTQRSLIDQVEVELSTLIKIENMLLNISESDLSGASSKGEDGRSVWQYYHPEKKKMTLFGSRTLWEWGQEIKIFCENITQLKKGDNTLKIWRLCENWHVIEPEVNVEHRENSFKYFSIGLYIL